MSDYIELQNKSTDETVLNKEIDLINDQEEEFDEEELHIDEELDEYLELYYNSLKIYDMMKSYVFKTNVPIYDNLRHMDVFDLLYPNYDNDKYFF